MILYVILTESSKQNIYLILTTASHHFLILRKICIYSLFFVNYANEILTLNLLFNYYRTTFKYE